MNPHAYSLNEEEFYSAEEAHGDAIADIQCGDHEVGDEVEYWVGNTVATISNISPLQVGNVIVDRIDSLLGDYVISDEPLIEISELDKITLGGMIILFLIGHSKFTSFKVTNVTKHTHIVE